MTSPEELKNKYNEIEKCKISGKIENIIKSSYDDCVYKLEITLKENNNYYKIISSELKNSDGSDFCIVDTTFPFYKNGNISYYPKIGDDFKGIIKKTDLEYPVLSYGEEVYNNFTGSKCESNYSGGVISTDDIFSKDILDNNSGNILKELNQKINIDSPKTTIIKKESNLKISTTNYGSNIKSTTGTIINSNGANLKEKINSGSLENSLNIINLSGSNLTQNYNSGKLVQSGSLENSGANFSNSGTITQEPVKIPQNNSNYYLSGSLILTFIIIGVLVFKLLKIKK